MKNNANYAKIRSSLKISTYMAPLQHDMHNHQSTNKFKYISDQMQCDFPLSEQKLIKYKLKNMTFLKSKI